MTAKFEFPDAVLRSHTAVLGMTGSGKTSTTKLLVEQVVAANRRVVVLDAIKSDWWGITSSASGKKPGLPFKILGGPHGHLPLASSAGKAIGQLVGNGKLPLSIIDMADFEPGGLQRFFVDFAASLWKHITGVVYVVIEEAHEFAPKERAGFGQENMAIHWAKKLATGSRTKGIRLIVASQSVQQLHNRVLGGCATLVAHRISFDADQEPVLRWLKAADKARAVQVGAELALLDDGTGWLCNGVAKLFQRQRFPKFATYDNTATPDADGPAAQVKTAPVDQAELRTILGDAVAQAEADDPKKLRADKVALEKENAHLKRQLAVPAAAPAVDVAAIEAAANQRARAHVLGVVESVLGPLAQASRNLADDLETALAVVREERQKVPAARPLAPAPAARLAPPARAPRARDADPITAPTPAAVDTEDHPPLGAERRPLAVLAGAYPGGMTEGQWCGAAKLKMRGGTWKAYVSRLRAAGRIEERDGLIYATQAGLDDCGADVRPMPAPGPGLVNYWADKVPGDKPKRMLGHLADIYPKWTDQQLLAAVVGLAEDGGTFKAYLSRLRSPGLVEEYGKQVRLAPTLMEAA